MVVGVYPEIPTAAEARARLAAEWRASDPRSPEDVARFYRDSEALADDLAAFHAEPGRQRWSEIAVHVARTPGVERVVDIGCGAGHDLAALRDALPELSLAGVEPNRALLANAAYRFDPAPMFADVEHAPIETADLLLCLDVLEHVPEPEAFLGAIARRARYGAMLVEATATHDCGTPLHLRANRGWHPGRVLEGAGWVRIDEEGRVRVWRREHVEAPSSATAILCARRTVSLPTHRALMQLARRAGSGWRFRDGGEAGINRSRSIQASIWWRETADDVFLMIDDDVVFTPGQADQIVAEARAREGIVCGAYPVHDGGHLALRGNEDTLAFGAGTEPRQIRHGATGFMAVHRRVLDAMVPTLPLCHATQPWAFWPFFDFQVIEDEDAGGHNYLSEDYVFCERAAALGFAVWVDPRIILGHLSEIPLDVFNMTGISNALRGQG